MKKIRLKESNLADGFIFGSFTIYRGEELEVEDEYAVELLGIHADLIEVVTEQSEVKSDGD